MTDYNPDLDGLVWGAAAIAKIVNRNVRQTFHLLEQGHLDADKVGGLWSSSPRRLLFGNFKATAKRGGGRADG
jgi:hypothetical protein